MRAVIDTNVVVSAAINPAGTPARLVDAWKARSFDWVTSPPLLAEIEGVLGSAKVRRFVRWSAEERARFLAALSEIGHMAVPTRRLDVVADPADNRVIEAAVEGQAGYIVTGDSRLLALGEYAGVQIVTPARFIAIILSTSL